MTCPTNPQSNAAIIIDNSPIEFVLVGPRGEGTGLLLRTRNAGLDLVGACLDRSRDKRLNYLSWWADHLLGSRYTRTISTVWSNPTSITSLVDDKRLGSFTFSWLGMTEPIERKKIQEQFNNRITDLQNAIAQSDQERIEWFLGPIVAICVLAEKRHSLYRVLIRWSLIFILGSLILLTILRAIHHF
jgi:hypothetical protein